MGYLTRLDERARGGYHQGERPASPQVKQLALGRGHKFNYQHVFPQDWFLFQISYLVSCKQRKGSLPKLATSEHWPQLPCVDAEAG